MEAKGNCSRRSFVQACVPATVLSVVIVAGLAAGRGGQTGLVLSFERGEEESLVGGAAARRFVHQHATNGTRALRVDLSEPAPILTLHAQRQPFDFSGWEKLKLDVYRDGPPLTVNLRVRDDAGRTYTAWYYLIQPGFQVVEYSILGMSSALDVSRVNSLEFFASERSGVLYVDNVRLSKGPDDDSWLLARRPRVKSAKGGINLIQNGDFELGLQYWGSWGQWDGGRYLFGSGSGADAVSGAASAAIICQRRGRGGIFSNPAFTLSPGQYQFRFYVKGKGGGTRMFWQFEGRGWSGRTDGLNVEGPDYRIRFDVPKDWVKKEYRVAVSRPIDNVRIYFYSVGTGTVFIDGVSLEPLQAARHRRVMSEAKGRPRHVELRGGSVWVDGKPFFAIGFYNAEPEALRETGFNLICHDPGPGPIGLEFLDRCQRAGVMVSVNMEGIMRAHLPWQAAEFIKPFQRHPAVLAWYVCDEPDHARWTVPPPEMRLATKLLHEADPHHLTWTVVMPWADSNIYQYADSVDIIATDMYPIADYKRDVLRVAHAADVLRRSVKGKRPVWMVTEATAKATPEEEYAMSYLAVTHGVSGIVYWNFADARRDPHMWSTMKRIAGELAVLAPVLCSPSEPVEVEASSRQVHVLAKRHAGKLYVICVNGSKERQANVIVTLPASSGRAADVLFESRSIAVKAGRLVDSFKPYERHVYVLEM